MKSTKYLLIGGGLASSQAAKQLRAHDGRGAITLVGEEPYVPYDRPPLSKEFLRGEKRGDELFFDPEQYFHDQDIGLVLGVAVQRLNLDDKTAILANGEAIRFEKALIATGVGPFVSSSPAVTCLACTTSALSTTPTPSRPKRPRGSERFSLVPDSSGWRSRRP